MSDSKIAFGVLPDSLEADGDPELKLVDNGDDTFSLSVHGEQMGTIISNQTTIIANQTTIISHLAAIDARLAVGINVKTVLSL